LASEKTVINVAFPFIKRFAGSGWKLKELGIFASC